MARRIDRLTDKTVKAKKEGGLYADGDGLFLRVTETKSGVSKSWVFRFKQKREDGKFRARDMGLGGYPSVSLAKARQKAKDAREHRGDGKDPIKERDVAALAQRLADARLVTFKDAAGQFIEANKASWKSPKHKKQWTDTLAWYAYPVLGDVPVADITTELVLAVLQPIWTTKTETASRVRGRIERVLSFARVRGWRSGENPAVWRGNLAEALAKPSAVAPVEHHAAMPYAQVPAFMARLRAKRDTSALALELTILTALRTNEARGARFEEFDLAAKVWTVPAERMKMRREHRVPLCDRAVAIVKQLAAVRVSEFVFSGLKRNTSISPMTMLMLLYEMEQGVTVHGFRSSFRDWAGETTYTPPDVCEAALAHGRDKTNAAYQRGDLFDKRRVLMDAWAAYCDTRPAKPAKAKENAAEAASIRAA